MVTELFGRGALIGFAIAAPVGPIGMLVIRRTLAEGRLLGLLSGLGLGTTAGDYRAAGIVVAGVFVGSALWWLLLSGGVALVRHKLKPGTMKWINYGSGTFLSAFGVYAMVSLSR